MLSMTVIGISDGCMVVLGGPILAKLYGTRHLEAVKSTMTSANILSTGISPPIVGILLDIGADIGFIFYGFVGYACFVWLLLFMFLRKKLS